MTRPTRTAKRRSLAILAAALLLVLGAGAALAGTITCPGGDCLGTDAAESLEGTAGTDQIYGFGGADTIAGRGGIDYLRGDNQFNAALDGADRIAGGAGADQLTGYGGADLLAGGPGDDYINAQELAAYGHPAGKDTVRGGRGNDEIRADDGHPDSVDCGPGADDAVWFDKGVDTLVDCERKYPA